MARGWGKSEEDQAADKEQLRERQRAQTADAREVAREAARRRGIEMSLARIEDELRATEHPARRQALEAARAELRAQFGATTKRDR